MIFKIILIIIFVVFTALIITFFEDIKNFRKTKISFKEALDLTELPVVTFISENNKKLNFLLDTGANNSILNDSVVKDMKLEIIKTNSFETNTAGGNINLDKLVNLNIKYDKKAYNEYFLVCDMNEAFASIKEESGVTIHGILGSNFFVKHKYILDFDNLALYIK